MFLDSWRPSLSLSARPFLLCMLCTLHSLFSTGSIFRLSFQKFFWTNLLLCSSQVKQNNSGFLSYDKCNHGWRCADPRIHYNQSGLLLLGHMLGRQTYKIFTVLTFYPRAQKSIGSILNMSQIFNKLFFGFRSPNVQQTQTDLTKISLRSEKKV